MCVSPPVSGRPDVFMSYAREDQAFVRRLCEALAARGKDVWVEKPACVYVGQDGGGFKRLDEAQIKIALVGHEFTDSVHWSHKFLADGTTKSTD